MSDDANMSLDAPDASIHASNDSTHDENPADISGMSLDDVELDGKYKPEEVATAVMLQDPESDDGDDDDDEEYVPKDEEEEEEDELADDPDLEPEPKPERGRLAGSDEESLEVVHNIYGTKNPFYSESANSHRVHEDVLDEVDREEAVLTDGEDDDVENEDDDDDEDEIQPSADCGVTIDKLDLNDDDEDDKDYVPDE